MPDRWTLNSELCRAAGRLRIDDAVVKLGLVEPGDRVLSVSGRAPWVRGGAETFIFRFTTVSEKAGAREFIIKAFAPTTFAISLDDQLTKVFRRRELLQVRGVPSPDVHYRGSGIWIEDYVPFTLKEALLGAAGDGDPAVLEGFVIQLSSIVNILDTAGYEPTVLCPDLRATASAVYMIDFGADLGEAGVSRSKSHCFDTTYSWLRGLDTAGARPWSRRFKSRYQSRWMSR